MRVFEPSIKILHNELIKISKNSDVAITIKNSNSDYKPVSPKVFIRLNKINFNFEDNKNNLLNNIDMTIAEGQRVAIIGKTGSGKSTLMQVMLGLLRPTKGEVLYKNDNIFLNLKEWYKNISYVSQNTFLLDADLKTNITFEKNHKKINSEKLLHSIEVANLKDKIFSLKDKLDEYVGTDGIRLSGGEKQRIALARLFIAIKIFYFWMSLLAHWIKKLKKKYLII